MCSHAEVRGVWPAGLAWGLQSAPAEVTDLVTLTIFVSGDVPNPVTIDRAWGENLGKNPRFCGVQRVGMGFAWLEVSGRGHVDHRAAGAMIQPRNHWR